MSSSMSTPKRSYLKEIAPFVNKRISLVLKNGQVISGDMKGIDPDTLTCILVKARNNETKETYHRICIAGTEISQFFLEEAPFDLVGLKEELERIFNRPGDVKLYDEAGLIVVLERVKVSEHGVEGSGPVADRVRSIFKRYAQTQTSD